MSTVLFDRATIWAVRITSSSAGCADNAVVVEVASRSLMNTVPSAAADARRVVDYDEQFVDLERLLEVVDCPELHGLDGALDGGVRSHHQDLRPVCLRRGGDQLSNQIQAGEVRHQVVHDQDVEDALGEQPLRLACAGGGDDLVPFTAQRAGERAQDLGFVVNQKMEPVGMSFSPRSALSFASASGYSIGVSITLRADS